MFGSQSIGITRILVPDSIGRAQCLVLSLLEADSIGRAQFLLHNSIGSVQFFFAHYSLLAESN
jgi:ABC-type taurine transport system substrate-binding protein